DLNGDGKAEIVTGTGSGGGAHLRVWNLIGGSLVDQGGILVYPAGFTGGVRVAVGDADGRGGLTIITRAGTGGGPHARVLKLLTLFGSPAFLTLQEFFAYDMGFTGGVYPAGFNP